jgi:Subtilase family
MKIHLPSPPRKGHTRRRSSRRNIVTVSIIILFAVGVIAAGIVTSPRGIKVTAQSSDISPEALAQIDALIAEKDSRAGVNTKIDSQLIYELKMDRGQPVANGVQTVETDVEIAPNHTTVVDMTANVNDGLLARLRSMGGVILSSDTQSVRASLPLERIEDAAALADVQFIQPKQMAATSQDPGQVVTDLPGSVQPSFAGRAAKVRSALESALSNSAVGNVAGVPPPTGQGSRSSEGDVTHGAYTARGTFHANGAGIKIGVLSDGVTNLAASQAAGDLGPVTVLPGQTGSGDEGTAMLEIVHDIAPGAQLYFATAFTSITSFAQNIRDLRTAGCDIIVDDVFYFVETPFQDGQAPGVVSTSNGGVVIQAVNDVTAAGAMYFSSAGNSGNLSDGQSGTWEGDFADGGPTASPLATGNRLHSFGGQNWDVINVAGTGPVSLYWSDPLGTSNNDYDLFILNSAGSSVLASSTNIQAGARDPLEQTATASQVAGRRIVIVKKAAAAARFLHLETNRGRLSIGTSGVTHGHNSAPDAFGTAATPARGPFPNLFSAANSVETFSSDGPRRVFYLANGTPYTPGNFTATGGVLRQEPVITAADGVAVTGVGGFSNPFFGTSAAAPHAAAIAALLKSANPGFTNAQIRTALINSAIDIEGPGTDRDSGAGIVMPYGAMQSLGVSGTAFLEFGSITALENPGDGNGNIDAGDGASLTIQLRNTGVSDATAISSTLTTSTPGVYVHLPNTSAYADLAAGGGSGTNLSPFGFTVAGNVPCPTTIQFTLTVNFTGGVSPQVMNFSVLAGPPTPVINSSLDLVAPTAGPGFTTSTGTIGVRHFRDGIASTCATPKTVFPGTTQPGNRQYDAYTFTTCANAAASCVTVTFSGANAINLYSAAYTGAFNPADLSQNFLADPGSSAASRTYAFNLPAGAQTFTIVVYDVPPNLATPSGSTYSLNVAGSCIGACPTPNQVPVAKAKNVTVSADANCQANASIDDGSFDPDGDPLTITQSPAGPYPLGTTNVLLTVSDPRGATSQASATVTVVDDTGPSVTGVSASPNTLWAPNHQMVPITVAYTAVDNCSAVTCTLSVTSNEPINGLGDGDTAPDWSIVGPHNLSLRSERGGKGSGRIYTIKIDCVDAAGNHTIKTVPVTVPKSQSVTGVGLDSAGPTAAPNSSALTQSATPLVTGAVTFANSASVVYVPYLNAARNRVGTTQSKASTSPARKKKRTRNKAVR